MTNLNEEQKQEIVTLLEAIDHELAEVFNSLRLIADRKLEINQILSNQPKF